MLKLLVILGKGGCDYWRTWLPMEEMRKQGLATIRYLEPRLMTADEIGQGLKWCDIVHLRGLIGVEGLKTIRQYQALGVKVSTDYDDLHFNVSPFNPAYKHFGTEEVQVKDPTTGDIQDLWKDGKAGFDLKKNKVKFHSYVSILQEVDLITTTTLYLKGAMEQIGGRKDNIKVLPNAIDFDQWKPLYPIRDKYKDKFRFGWAVSSSHGEDWLAIKPALIDFLKSHQDATFVCIGDTHIDIKQALPSNQVEWYPFSNLWEGHYPLRMAMLGLDVGIAPLADLEFNKCKSPLKYEEYTAFGWPTIAQNMEPYSSHMVHGETGLLASDTDSWVRCLDALCKDSNLRCKLHFNALHAVKGMFDIKNIAREWYQVFMELVGQETIKV